jgi:mono/diheme cytochrome c family protein
MPKHDSTIALLLAVVAIGTLPRNSANAAEIDFNRDVRPILAANCFACHGPDDASREADLRLDRQTDAMADLGGRAAIVPGDAAKSELVRRITSDDPDVRMPPAAANKLLSADQIAVLRKWIEEGARYAEHWAFAPPRKANPPSVENIAWPRNTIDRFVLARLEAAGLAPSPAADRLTLVRRLYLDLIGLPPTLAEADAFANDSSADAYERLVDRLLASPHYGERWARPWLDLARYSDTNGYEKDRPRSIWPYRDWVIRALNADMPYDQFTIEQLAGDMLPSATDQQRIATGFNRNTMLNEEGGIDPLEYRYYAMVDRVATTATVWLGLTVGCAQCHTHKYDPITHTDYYRLMALLNNADEPDLKVREPHIANQRETLLKQIATLEEGLAGQFPPRAADEPTTANRQAHLSERFAQWLQSQRKQAVRWQVLRPTTIQSNLPRLELLEDGSVFASGDITKRDVFTLRFQLAAGQTITALRLEALPDQRLPAGGPGAAYYEGRKGDFFLSEVTLQCGDEPIKLASASHSYGKISVGSGKADAGNVIDGEGSTGWSTAGGEGQSHQLVLNLAEPLVAAEPQELQLTMLFERHFAASLGRFRWSATDHPEHVQATALPVEIESLLACDETSTAATDTRLLNRYFLTIAPELAEARKPIEQLRSKLPEFPETLVFQERPANHPRPTHRHHRGEYLQPREEVHPGLPEVFVLSEAKQPRNRLELARWLASRDNPLAARVAVNRAWQALLGRGLAGSAGDFGTQSPPPSHPELLDWLACELMDQGWSMKKLHRLIVTSATYRQSSVVTPQLAARDPENRLLTRGARFRVEAELIRDVALAASGLLTDKIGGPSVYPPQPESVTALAYGETQWTPSQGADRYRRSLYTFSKRTAPFAAFSVFDAPTGENCTAERERSNTPLQALTLLNDEMFLEAARALARPSFGEPEQTVDERIGLLFRRLLTRLPTADEIEAIGQFHCVQRERLTAGELHAAQIVGNESASADLAALVLVARALLNLDETITRH